MFYKSQKIIQINQNTKNRGLNNIHSNGYNVSLWEITIVYSFLEVLPGYPLLHTRQKPLWRDRYPLCVFGSHRVHPRTYKCLWIIWSPSTNPTWCTVSYTNGVSPLLPLFAHCYRCLIWWQKSQSEWLEQDNPCHIPSHSLAL